MKSKEESSQHKAGFVSIIGKPNAGKSTLMNKLVGERLSIITNKAQTTRHRIQGIISGEDFQIVYSDTPGILDPKYALQKNMMTFVHQSLSDADIIIYLVDAVEREQDLPALEIIKKSGTPILLVLNKIDLVKEKDRKKLVDNIKFITGIEDVICISALKDKDVNAVIDPIKERLPIHPANFPKDELTDKPLRFFTSEIIREKIFLNYHQEVPYSSQVEIESFKDKGHIIYIYAYILVERDSQKGIIIGKKGESLKKVGTAARMGLERFLDKKVFLDLRVKVRKDWRSREDLLKRYGY